MWAYETTVVVIENNTGRGGRPKSSCWISRCVLRVQLLDQLVLMINGVNRFCVPVIFVNVFIHAEICQQPTLSVCCEWSPRIPACFLNVGHLN